MQKGTATGGKPNQIRGQSLQGKRNTFLLSSQVQTLCKDESAQAEIQSGPASREEHPKHVNQGPIATSYGSRLHIFLQGLGAGTAALRLRKPPRAAASSDAQLRFECHLLLSHCSQCSNMGQAMSATLCSPTSAQELRVPVLMLETRPPNSSGLLGKEQHIEL